MDVHVCQARDEEAPCAVDAPGATWHLHGSGGADSNDPPIRHQHSLSGELPLLVHGDHCDADDREVRVALRHIRVGRSVRCRRCTRARRRLSRCERDRESDAECKQVD